MAWKRGLKTVEILRKREYKHRKFTVADILDIPGVLPTDKLDIETVDAYDYGDSAYDGHTDLLVTREVEYSDEEQRELEELMEQRKHDSQQERYMQYLRLKDEFENQVSPFMIDSKYLIEPISDSDKSKVLAEYEQKLRDRERRKNKNK